MVTSGASPRCLTLSLQCDGNQGTEAYGMVSTLESDFQNTGILPLGLAEDLAARAARMGGSPGCREGCEAPGWNGEVRGLLAI